MKKVIVTGINGLIGQYIKKPLEKLGFEVYGIGTRKKNEKNYYSVNLNNYIEVENIFNNLKPEYLIHLAWDTKRGYVDSDSNFEFIASSINMLKYFKENNGKKVIFLGTLAEYKFTDKAMKENDELELKTIYTKCKNYLREISELYCEKHNINFCWARIFNTYGENEHNDRLFPYIINSLKNNQKVSINFSQLKRDYIFAGDIAKILALIINSNLVGIINICTGKTISLEEIAIIIAKKMNKTHLLELYKKETKESIINLGDNSRILNELNFNEFTSIDKWINDYIK